MSFNRLKYDRYETKDYNKTTLGPGEYHLNTPIMCNNCLNDNPWIQNQKTGVSLNSNVDWRFYSGPVDVESDLLNLNRPASNCPMEKYTPLCDANSCSTGEPCGQGVSQGCKDPSLRNTWNRPGDNNLVNFPRCHFPVDDTRLNNPSSNLRGTGWNRFDPLFFNPQENIFAPEKFNVHTRMVVKDNHRSKMARPSVNSMDPKMQRVQASQTQSVPSNYTSAQYQYDTCG
jgi:hypothetical protein